MSPIPKLTIATNSPSQPLKPLPVPANNNNRRGVLTFIGEDEPYAAKPELVRDTMPRTGVGFYGGQSGAYKTFFAIHSATCFMTGEPLAGRDIERTGGVVYWAAEGEGTIGGQVPAHAGPDVGGDDHEAAQRVGACEARHRHRRPDGGEGSPVAPCRAI
ncbi:hypothetical protein EN844_28920 [Mesorhizobium sp. M3A.F.Ca.ET.201.01.1.1]|nr:hypothetical protein EN844_28920 [Mesorhizobium sp. M3A.F.Ca.ET.201.01.1.1]